MGWFPLCISCGVSLLENELCLSCSIPGYFISCKQKEGKKLLWIGNLKTINNKFLAVKSCCYFFNYLHQILHVNKEILRFVHSKLLPMKVSPLKCHRICILLSHCPLLQITGLLWCNRVIQRANAWGVLSYSKKELYIHWKRKYGGLWTELYCTNVFTSIWGHGSI